MENIWIQVAENFLELKKKSHFRLKENCDKLISAKKNTKNKSTCRSIIIILQKEKHNNQNLKLPGIEN